MAESKSKVCVCVDVSDQVVWDYLVLDWVRAECTLWCLCVKSVCDQDDGDY